MSKQGITVEEFLELCPDAQFVTDEERRAINDKIARGEMMFLGARPQEHPLPPITEKSHVTQEMIDAALKRMGY